MARPSVGTDAQHLTATALAAYVAARLHGLPYNRAARGEWLRETLTSRLGSNSLDRVAPRARSATKSWILVDEARLALDVVKRLVIFPGAGRRRPHLEAGLRRLGVVRQLLLTRSRRDLISVLVYDAPRGEEIFHSVERLGEPFLWEEILEEDRSIEATLWVELAKQFAADDGLLLEE
jgi:hypothetical protein